MIEEKSIGVVIYVNTQQNKFFLLLNYPSGHWDFVKGKIEKGETEKQTAIRETMEETGITDLKFNNKFKENIEYTFRAGRKKIHKKVIFYLAETNTTKIKISNEHVGFDWKTYDDAFNKITYQNAKFVLSKVKASINLKF
ncbi:MAG: NUDIX domain-containing protein [Nitrosopumilaceae archaeon]|nr:NUDIX domain-containing protein [Nitrosopumilaceae archaeon]